MEIRNIIGTRSDGVQIRFGINEIDDAKLRLSEFKSITWETIMSKKEFAKNYPELQEKTNQNKP